MLIYKGNRYVVGKKFTINESTYVFKSKDKNDRLVFESVKDRQHVVKLTEEEARRKARIFIKGLTESASEDDTPYYVELWETEEDRDMGEGFIYEYYATRDEAIKEAEKLWNSGDYAAVEADFKDENDDVYTILCGAEGELTYYNDDLKANK